MSPQVLPVPTDEDTERRAAEAREEEAKRKAREENGDTSPDFSMPAPETPSKNLFSDPPQYKIPRTIAKPQPQTDYGQELEESQKAYRSYEQQYVHNIQQSQKLMQEYNEKARPLLESMIDAQLHLNDQPPDIKPDPAIQKEIEAYQQKKPNGVFNIFQMMMLGLALAFSAFGWRRGWGARAGIMEGWGNAFKAFGQGQKDLAQQQADNAYRMQQLVWEENEDRHKQLAEVMANRRLSAEDKSRAFNELERLYGMDANLTRTQANMANQQMRTLQNQIRIQKDLRKLQLATHNGLSGLFGTEAGKQWRAMVVTETIKKDSVTGGRRVDPMRSEEELAEAEELYPYKEFLDTWKEGIGKPDPSDPSGKKRIQEPGFPQKPGQTQSLDEASKKFGERFLGSK